MNISPKRKVFLTFDVEDIINMQCSMRSLHEIFRLLEKYDLRGLFFITGNMAEKIRHYPEILRLLKAHEIGYHGTNHSVKGQILEFTDVESYTEAIEESLRRETSHVDPYTGKIGGKGGILILRQIFSGKNVISFRAPRFCWTPPHLEALRRLDFLFDFSTQIFNFLVFYKGITFYPYPVLIIEGMNKRVFIKHLIIFLFRFLKEKYAVICIHPHRFMYSGEWDAFNCDNLKENYQINLKVPKEVRNSFFLFELFLGILNFLRKIKLIDVTPCMKKSKVSLNTKEIDIEKICQMSVSRSKEYTGYNPKFLLSHYYHYFGSED